MLDGETQTQLRIIALETRLKAYDDLKLPQELNILQADVRALKKKLLELDKMLEWVSLQKAELVKKIKKINK